MPTHTTAKHVVLLAYESFAEFEVAVLLTALSGSRHRLTIAGLTGRPVTTVGGMTVTPSTTVAAVDVATVDALVVPGGDATYALGDRSVRRLVQALDSREALLAAICGGPAVLGDAGVLDGRRYTASLGPDETAYAGIAGHGTLLEERVVRDEHVLTATGSSYLDFAEAVLGHVEGVPVSLDFFRTPSLA